MQCLSGPRCRLTRPAQQPSHAVLTRPPPLQTGQASTVRRRLLELENGVCQLCGLNAQELFRRVAALPTGLERKAALVDTPYANWSPARQERLVKNPRAGDFWQADHVTPVCEGGGECDLFNYRTLCTSCHQGETDRLVTPGRKHRKLAVKAKGSKDIRGWFGAS